MVFTVWLCAACQGGWICSAVNWAAPPSPSLQCKYCGQPRSTSLALTLLVQGSQRVRYLRTSTNTFRLKTYWAKCSSCVCVCVCVCVCERERGGTLFLGWSAAVPYAHEVLLLLCVALCPVRTVHICDFRLVINWTPNKWLSLDSGKCSERDIFMKWPVCFVHTLVQREVTRPMLTRLEWFYTDMHNILYVWRSET